MDTLRSRTRTRDTRTVPFTRTCPRPGVATPALPRTGMQLSVRGVLRLLLVRTQRTLGALGRATTDMEAAVTSTLVDRSLSPSALIPSLLSHPVHFRLSRQARSLLS